MFKKLAVAIVLAAGSIGASQAAIVYTSPAFATASLPTGSQYCASSVCNFEPSDVFTLSSAATISGADFAILAIFPRQWNIQIGIWDTALTTQFFTVTMAYGSYALQPLGNSVDMVSASFAGPTLPAGSYRMSWYEPIDMSMPGYVQGTGIVSSSPRINGATMTIPHPEGFAFQISSAVPEPGTYALMVLGLAGVGFAIRRR